MRAAGLPMSRRWAAALAGGVFCAVLSTAALAGAQKEEALADSVRGALAAAIADNRPVRPTFASGGEKLGYLKWLGEMSRRLESKLPDPQTRVELIETVYYEAKRAGLEPSLVLGL